MEGAVLRRILSGNLLLYARRCIGRLRCVGVLKQECSGSALPGDLQSTVQIVRYNRTDCVWRCIVSDVSVVSRHLFYGVIVSSHILEGQLIECDVSILIVDCIANGLSVFILQYKVEFPIFHGASGQSLLDGNLSGDRGFLRGGAVRIVKRKQRCRLWIHLRRDVALSIIRYRYLYGLGLGVVGNSRVISGFGDLIGKGLLRRIAQIVLSIGNGSEVHTAVGSVLHFRLLRHRCVGIIGSNLKGKFVRLQHPAFQYFQSFKVYCCLFRLIFILEIQLISGSGFHGQLSGSVILHYYPEGLGLGVLLQRTVTRCILGYRIVNAVLCATRQDLLVRISLCHQLLQVGDGVGQGIEVNRRILSVSGSSGDYRIPVFVTGIVYAELELPGLDRQLVLLFAQKCLRSFRRVLSGCLVGVSECRCLFLNRGHDAVLLEHLNLKGLRLGVIGHSGFSAIFLRYGKSIFPFLGEFRSAEGEGGFLAVLHTAQACIRIGQHDVFLIDGLLSGLIPGLQCEIECLTIQHAASHQFLRTGNGRIAFHGRRCILIGKYHFIRTLAAGGDALFCFQFTAYIRYLISQGVFGGVVIVAGFIAQFLGDLVGIDSGLGKGNLSEVRLSFACNRFRLLTVHTALRHRCIVCTGESEAEGAVLRRISSGNLLLHARSHICRIYPVGVLEQNRTGSALPGYLQCAVQIIRYNCADFVWSRIVSDVAVVSGHFLYGVVIGAHVLEGQLIEGDVSILIVDCIANGLSIFILQYEVEFTVFHGASGQSLLNLNLSGYR